MTPQQYDGAGPQVVHVIVEKKKPHPARVPLWGSVFLVPFLAHAGGLPDTLTGGLFLVWTLTVLVILARLPHTH